jgi:hypothetical protein
MEEYICDGCNENFSVPFNKTPKRCPFCDKNYIRKERDGLKKVAIVNGSISGRLRIVIHQGGYIEFIDFLGEHTVNPDFDIEREEELDEKQYHKLISNV